MNLTTSLSKGTVGLDSHDLWHISSKDSADKKNWLAESFSRYEQILSLVGPIITNWSASCELNVHEKTFYTGQYRFCGSMLK